MSSQLNDLYKFEDFRLDGRAGTLWRGDEVVSLSPKAAEVLKLLVVSQGRVVSKQEIFDSVWADTFVEDGVLTQNIYTLRHALGRDGNGRQFIETVPRRGYRFAGRITVMPADERAARVGGEVPSSAVRHYDDDTLSADYLDDSTNYGTTVSPEPRPAEPVPIASARVTTPSRKLSRIFFAVLSIFVLGAAGFGIYKFWPARGNVQQAAIAPIEQIRFQSLTDTGDIIHPTISPDGETLAFVRMEGEQASVWVQQIETRSDVQILPPSRKGYRSLAFSSDGKYLFFRDEADPGSIYQASRLGGTPKKVADNVWSDFSVSPDSSQFAFIRRDAPQNAQLLVLSNASDGTERVIGTRKMPFGYRGAAPAWSPDGKTLALGLSSAVQTGRPMLARVDVETGQETELETPRFREITRVLWTPDAEQLIVAARLNTEPTSQIWMVAVADGQVRRLTNDLEAYFWLSLSADGRTLVTRQQRIIAELWVLPDGDLKKARQLTTGGRTLDGFVGLAWTQDGKIVFSTRSGNFSDLYSLAPDTNERIQLTSGTGENTWPVVSRDGRYILFVSTRSGARAVWRMDADGGNHKQLTSADDGAYAPAPSPNGNDVFFIKFGAGPSAIWKTSIEGQDAVPVSQLVKATAESYLAVSPDGNWLAYHHVADDQKNRGEDGTMQIGVVTADGSGEPRLFDVTQRRPVFHWTSDDAFDYAAGTFNASSLWRQPLNGEAKKLIDFPDRIFNFAWSADGKDLVVSRGRLHGDAVLISNLP